MNSERRAPPHLDRYSWEREFRLASLPSRQKVAGFAIATHISRKLGSCFLSYETLAAETGVSSRTAKQAVKELVDVGWLSKTAGGGRGNANVYRLVVPHGYEWRTGKKRGQVAHFAPNGAPIVERVN